MADVRIRLNPAGVRALLRSPAVLADLQDRAEAVASAAGDGHRTDSQVGRNRARAAVITHTHAARRREATSRDLTRAIDAAR